VHARTAKDEVGVNVKSVHLSMHRKFFWDNGSVGHENDLFVTNGATQMCFNWLMMTYNIFIVRLTSVVLLGLHQRNVNNDSDKKQHKHHFLNKLTLMSASITR